MDVITHKNIQCDFAVAGGGLAGLCAAVAAARNGMKTVLFQDRPVLGGNNSSEIRVHIGSAYGIVQKDKSILEYREGGIIEELLLRNLYVNPSLKWTIWDHVMYQFAKDEKNLTVLLNTPVQSLEMDGSRIKSITGWNMEEYCTYTAEAKYYADCSGNSILRLSGAECTRGREGKARYGESLAPDQPDMKGMGSSEMISAFPSQPEDRKFIPPGEKLELEFDDSNVTKQWSCISLDRKLKDHPPALESGGEQDILKEADKIRDELFDIAYAYWDYLKKTKERHAEKWEIDWIGSIPGKRESFRYVGDHILTQRDIEAEGKFPDTVCHGGWPMDDHFPEGYRSPKQTIMNHAPTPYGIPYRSLYSKNVDNLFFAGRNISESHIALSSTRVMGTCACMGQAIGTAASIAMKYGITPRDTGKLHLQELQELLQDQDQYLPFMKRNIPQLSASAKISHEILRDGWERELRDGDHGVWFAPGESCSYEFEKPTKIERIRLILDTDCHDNRRLHNDWELRHGFREMPPMTPRDFSLEVQRSGKWDVIQEWTDFHKRLLIFSMPDTGEVTAVRIVWKKAWGMDKCHVFSFEVR